MLRLSTLIVLFAATTVAGCASSASTAAAPVTTAPPSAYQRDITAMARYCTQDPTQLEAMVAKVHQLEVKGGASGETMTQLAGHLLTVVSAYKSRVSCVDPFAAYLTLRTGQ